MARVCWAATTSLGLRGVVIRLLPVADDPGIVVALGAESRALGDLEVDAGEGPGQTAHRSLRPVLAADLAGKDGARWPGFSSAALEAGVQAVYVAPLSVGAVTLGTLEAFAAQAGPLGPQQSNLLLAFAEIAIACLLDHDAWLDESADHRELARALDHRAEIAQAQGMVMIDLGVTLAVAMALLRAHAFAEQQPLHDLARRVVGGYRLPATDPEQP